MEELSKWKIGQIVTIATIVVGGWIRMETTNAAQNVKIEHLQTDSVRQLDALDSLDSTIDKLNSTVNKLVMLEEIRTKGTGKAQ